MMTEGEMLRALLERSSHQDEVLQAILRTTERDGPSGGAAELVVAFDQDRQKQGFRKAENGP